MPLNRYETERDTATEEKTVSPKHRSPLKVTKPTLLLARIVDGRTEEAILKVKNP